jgi:hypothetical protein
MKRILGLVAIGCVSSLVWVASVSAAAGDATCSGTAPPNVANDLIVPAGTTCTIGPGSKVGYDVIVNQGATLLNQGGQIGHNIQATAPAGIALGGGTAPDGTFLRGRVGNDVTVNGITGAGSGIANFICSTDIVHDVVLTNATSSAGEWVVGDTDPELCRFGNTVGHDLVVQNNKNLIEVSDNSQGPAPPYGVGHDLRVTGNTQAPVVEGNTVFHDAVCQSNLTSDGDHEPNVAGHTNTCG